MTHESLMRITTAGQSHEWGKPLLIVIHDVHAIALIREQKDTFLFHSRRTCQGVLVPKNRSVRCSISPFKKWEIAYFKKSLQRLLPEKLALARIAASSLRTATCCSEDRLDVLAEMVTNLSLSAFTKEFFGR